MEAIPAKLPFLATNVICKSLSEHPRISPIPSLPPNASSNNPPVTQVASAHPSSSNHINQPSNPLTIKMKTEPQNGGGLESKSLSNSKVPAVEFKYLALSFTSKTSRKEIILCLLQKQVQLSEEGVGVGIATTERLPHHYTTTSLSASDANHGLDGGEDSGTQESIYLFELACRKSRPFSSVIHNPNIIPKKYLDLFTFKQDLLDLSFDLPVDLNSTTVSSGELERFTLMSALNDALYNWFEGILSTRGWIRFGFLFVWQGDQAAADISGDWKHIFSVAEEVKSPIKKHVKPPTSLKKKVPESPLKIDKGTSSGKSNQVKSESHTVSSTATPFAFDLGISLCVGMGLVLNPSEVPFEFERLESRHFADGKGPKHVFIAPNAIEATLCSPYGVYMDRMNILLHGKQMPVSFESRFIFVPILGNQNKIGPLVRHEDKLSIEKADLFWGRINENATFAVGGETGGTDSPLLVGQTLNPSGSGAHERSGSGNRLKKDGKSTTASASGLSQTEKKKASLSNSNTSPKLPVNSPAATTTIAETKKPSQIPAANTSKKSNTTSAPLQVKQEPTASTKVNDIDMNTNLPIDLGFKAQSFGGLALDMVDDDDFDFFETKTSSAGDASGSAIPGTANTAGIVAGETPGPGDGASIMGQSPPPGATPSGFDPATPFVFSPPPVVMHDATSPGGTAIPNMYATTPDNFRSPGYQSFSPPHKSTPATPFGFVQSPNTPGPSYDTPYSGAQVAPFHFEAKVIIPSKLATVEEKGDEENPRPTCPPSWLPFDIDLETLLGGKNEYGSHGKWDWKPNQEVHGKQEKFSLKPFRRATDTAMNARKRARLERFDFYPPLDIFDARVTLPFSSTYHTVRKDDVINCEWSRMSLYECVSQLYLFPNGQEVGLNPPKALSLDLWTKVKQLCSHSILADGDDVEPDHINLSDYLKVEDDEEANFAIYGTIKLRKKKGKLSTVENLPPHQLLAVHNSCNIVCNQEVLRFWSKCKIAPIAGPKSVKWISIFPKANSILLSQRIPFYMSQMESVWDLLSFGVLEPCHVVNQSVPGLVPVVISENHENVYEHVMANYYRTLPSIAESIIDQVLPNDSQHCMVMIWNPFPADNTKAIYDISCLFLRLVHLIQVATSCSASYVASRVYLEIRHSNSIFTILDRDQSSRPEMERNCFLNYNRLQRLYDGQFAVHAPAFSIENVQCEPKFSLDTPQTLSPLLLFEPDRIIYLFYGDSGKHMFAFWSDIFGEFKHQVFHPSFQNPEEMVEFLLDSTFSFLGHGGFIPRLVVCNVDGWALSSVNVWKMAIHAHADLLKGATEDGDSGGSTEEHPNSAATTPTSISDTGNGKIFPSTPVSAYTTPQPDHVKKAPYSGDGGKSLPVLGSLSLVSCKPSRLAVTSSLPTVKHGVDEWFQKESSIQYTPCNKLVPWSAGEVPSLAKSWIMQESDTEQASGGVEGSLLWHWQAEYSTTCFPHWHEAGSGKRSSIIKDIMKGLYNQRITNERQEWIFQRVQRHVLILAGLQ